ncbi:MAG: bifunctional UDP-N-acetylglucosamine diphosphorylase/glucosamine-1-phosphate N-acetyltransferase GlmU [Alphaproteobacteria bacterium]|nr:bifunctional UDP-N-acetylglucosamine diphosphorylase/glucosamine-1-phosphate N-acetyltransferase GlmU [Alphaproteobacteria bacterium]MCL2505035.1 bifunctional UDP-N-acetylglucosamine diphosphorylase/glucosamine-1-phosphate N-acetyltransferase GlmU [Alphaproteobacteria bacterium]
MENGKLACVILAAGKGTRMKSDLPKVLHSVAGCPMLAHVIKACEEANADTITVVVSDEALSEAVKPYKTAIQKEQLGTGDAVKAAKDALSDFKGNVLVAFGDAPLITSDTIKLLVDSKESSNASISVACFSTPSPEGYGRIVKDGSGYILKIVEAVDCSKEELKITLCNGGIMLFDSEKLWKYLERIDNNNKKKEYFLTDCIALSVSEGDKVSSVLINQNELLGVNSQKELAMAESVMQERLRNAVMENGVTMLCPDSVYLSHDTVIGKGTVIEPNVIIKEKVVIGENVTIKAFSYLEGTVIENNAVIGPFARIRPSSHIHKNVHIGNFVEVKNSEIKSNSKANHLSYIGDAEIGTNTNIGAGTITANYDGFNKHKTTIGDNVSVGSDTVLVAPVSVADNAIIAAGTVITQDVPENALAIARVKQENKEGFAGKIRNMKSV